MLHGIVVVPTYVRGRRHLNDQAGADMSARTAMTNGHLTDARSKGDGSSIDEKLETWQTNLKFQRWVALLRYLATWRYEALREPALHYLTKPLLSIKNVFFAPQLCTFFAIQK